MHACWCLAGGMKNQGQVFLKPLPRACSYPPAGFELLLIRLELRYISQVYPRGDLVWPKLRYYQANLKKIELVSIYKNKYGHCKSSRMDQAQIRNMRFKKNLKILTLDRVTKLTPCWSLHACTSSTHWPQPIAG